MPHGGVANDYVPFYFSPITSFTFTIHKENVELRAPDGTSLGKANDNERMFFVCAVSDFHNSDLDYCFSDFALNSKAPIPEMKCDLADIETHVHWNVFDNNPYKARISEIGYAGVCRFFANVDTPPERQNRSHKRMAEFLVKDAVPLSFVTCIIAKSAAMQQSLEQVMAVSQWDIPIYVKPDCYF